MWWKWCAEKFFCSSLPMGKHQIHHGGTETRREAGGVGLLCSSQRIGIRQPATQEHPAATGGSKKRPIDLSVELPEAAWRDTHRRDPSTRLAPVVAPASVGMTDVKVLVFPNALGESASETQQCCVST